MLAKKKLTEQEKATIEMQFMNELREEACIEERKRIGEWLESQLKSSDKDFHFQVDKAWETIVGIKALKRGELPRGV